MGFKASQKPLLLWIILGFFGLVALFGVTSYFTARDFKRSLSTKSGHHFHGKGEVALMKIQGVIMESETALDKLDELEEDDSIKAVVIRIDSPGGAVGPSQEIYNSVRNLRASKKVYCSLGDLAASGGYYIASACERIFANPGTLTGSIGVIMEFMNLRGLYDWAKVDPMVLKAGKFKDIGSQSRSMTDDERKLMQGLLDQVHAQFKEAVFEGRNDIGMAGAQDPAKPTKGKEAAKSLAKKTDDKKASEDQGPPPKTTLSRETLNEYADGRVLTGEAAQKLGFVDELGGLRDTLDAVAADAGLDGDYDVRKEGDEHSGLEDLFDFASSQSKAKRLSAQNGGIDGIVEHVIDRLLPGAHRSAELRPGVPYYLPSYMFSEGPK